MTVTGGYVRHRDRMVQASVFEDLKDTLIACRWLAGTTAHPVVDPDDRAAGFQILTTATNRVLPLLGKREDGTTVAQLVLIDYFPDAGGNKDEAGESRKAERNTFAVDEGVPGDTRPVELGSNMVEQPYVFAMAFYASSDAVAKAVLNDLRDRYQGRLVRGDSVALYDYNDPTFDADTPPITRLEVDSFTYEPNTTTAAPWEVNLYFARLELTDVVDASEASVVPEPYAQPGVWVGDGGPDFDAPSGSEYIDLTTGDVYEESE